MSKHFVYRVGLIGTGGNAPTHGRACRLVERTELVAICDISPTALNRFGDEYGIARRYTRLDDLLAQEELDIAIVNTWGASHAEISNRLARSRRVRAILVEKPMALNAAECAQMIAVAHEQGVRIVEGLKVLHQTHQATLREILAAGRIGAVRALHVAIVGSTLRSAAPDDWRLHRDRGGGSVYDIGCYAMAIARYVLGAEPERVYAAGTFRAPYDVDLSAAILLQFPDQVVAHCTCSFDSAAAQPVQVIGTQGWVRLDLHENEHYRRGLEVFTDACDTEVYHFGPSSPFERQLRNLCDHLGTDAPLRVSPEFSVGNARVLDAVFESMRTGNPVEVRP
jgi:D-xylose 1-dehydrogenase (NADP+, D-xylono-1,5-lactone-forming)